MWVLMCQTEDISKHKNESIRKCYYQIIYDLISNGQYEEIIHLCNKFCESKDLFYFFEEAFSFETEPITILNML